MRTARLSMVLDTRYLEEAAKEAGVADLLDRALSEV